MDFSLFSIPSFLFSAAAFIFLLPCLSTARLLGDYIFFHPLPINHAVGIRKRIIMEREIWIGYERKRHRLGNRPKGFSWPFPLVFPFIFSFISFSFSISSLSHTNPFLSFPFVVCVRRWERRKRKGAGEEERGYVR
jgi:hypothetical protein